MHAGLKRPNQPPGDSARRAGDCLTGTALLAHGQKLLDLNRRLCQHLPPWFERAMLADVRGDRAVFLAPSSAAATRLRLEQRQLRNLLLAFGEPADTIIVKVAQPSPAPTAPSQLKPLSPAAASHLQAAAASSSDPELKAQFLALASLAEHA